MKQTFASSARCRFWDQIICEQSIRWGIKRLINANVSHSVSLLRNDSQSGKHFAYHLASSRKTITTSDLLYMQCMDILKRSLLRTLGISKHNPPFVAGNRLLLTVAWEPAQGISRSLVFILGSYNRGKPWRGISVPQRSALYVQLEIWGQKQLSSFPKEQRTRKHSWNLLSRNTCEHNISSSLQNSWQFMEDNPAVISKQVVLGILQM